MALIIGVIGGVSESRFVKAFINGAADMMSVVLIIALARSITVLMASTGLDMWILNNAANALAGMSAIIFAPLSFLLYIVLSFLIPSSSGMATVSMPIMGGLASQLNFSVETMVMIYSAGNGLVNLFTPTSGAIMGGLALAKIEYSTWLKFGAKLFVVPRHRLHGDPYRCDAHSAWSSLGCTDNSLPAVILPGGRPLRGAPSSCVPPGSSSFWKMCHFGPNLENVLFWLAKLENVLFCFRETPSLTWYNSRFPRSEA